MIKRSTDKINFSNNTSININKRKLKIKHVETRMVKDDNYSTISEFIRKRRSNSNSHKFSFDLTNSIYAKNINDYTMNSTIKDININEDKTKKANDCCSKGTVEIQHELINKIITNHLNQPEIQDKQTPNSVSIYNLTEYNSNHNNYTDIQRSDSRSINTAVNPLISTKSQINEISINLTTNPKTTLPKTKSGNALTSTKNLVYGNRMKNDLTNKSGNLNSSSVNIKNSNLNINHNTKNIKSKNEENLQLLKVDNSKRNSYIPPNTNSVGMNNNFLTLQNWANINSKKTQQSPLNTSSNTKSKNSPIKNTKKKIKKLNSHKIENFSQSVLFPRSKKNSETKIQIISTNSVIIGCDSNQFQENNQISNGKNHTGNNRNSSKFRNSYQEPHSLNVSTNQGVITKIHTPRNESHNNYSESETESPLSNQTISKLNKIRNSIVELLNNGENKNLILNELKSIYKHIFDSKSPIDSNINESKFYPLVANKSPSNICSRCSEGGVISLSREDIISTNVPQNKNSEIHNLKIENENLKNKIHIIDKKFDKIYEENNLLKDYVKEKTNNLEELKIVLQSFQSDLYEIKQQNLQNAKINTSFNQSSFINFINPENETEDISQPNLNSAIKISTNLTKINNSNNIEKEFNNLDREKVFHIKVNEEVKDNKNIINEPTECDLEFIFKTQQDNLSEKLRTGCFGSTSFSDDNKKDDKIDNLDFTEDEEFSDDSKRIKTHSSNHEKVKIRQLLNSNSLNPNSDKILDISSELSSTKIVGLNFSNLQKQKDFNEEFMQNYENFSPSWRLEADKIKLKKSNE